MTKILLCVLLAMLAPAHAAPFNLEGYQGADGAIVERRHGTVVDPYLATNALLLAQQGGLDVAAAARAWITWLLPRQQRNGLFGRYCRHGNGWQRCDRLGADDAMQARWLQLLYAQAPTEGFPAPWQASAQRSWAALGALRIADSGVYRARADVDGALFIDNVEIFAALDAISRGHYRGGPARAVARRAENLRLAISQVFRPSGQGRFLASTDDAPLAARAYPAHVAPLYPLLYRVALDGADPRDDYADWLSRHGREWLRFDADQDPLGVAAVAALAMGDRPTAYCWHARGRAMRNGARWSVLDEAAYQRVAGGDPFGQPACERQ